LRRCAIIDTELLPGLTTCCYCFLFMAVVFLWIPYKPKIPLWIITFALACIFGLVSKQLDMYAVFPIFTLAYALHYFKQKNAPLVWRVIASIVILLLSCGLGAHLFPYFHNLKVLSNVAISQDGIPFTLYLNYDKTIVGLFILGLTQPLLTKKTEWLAVCKQTIPMAIKFIFILVLLARLAGEVHFDPKLPACLPIWLITNLLFVCVAEEAIFRGFIQKNLAVVFINFKWGNLLALVIASLLFGFAHYAGGIAYSIWGTIAGLGYGWFFQKTKQIESSILVHFSLNLVHFLLFTYPALG